MQETILLIDGANLHDAEHMVEGMIAGTAAPDVTSLEMHLRLAASSTIVENSEDAIHHLEHYSGLIAVELPEAAIALEAIGLIEAGELADAEHEISELLGVDDEDHDENEDEEEHEDEEAHEGGG